MNFKIIAVDFDGALCENKWPEIGEANTVLIDYLKKQKAAGNKIILWTCRVGEILENAVSWSAEHGLIFDAVNENLPETLEWMKGDSRKIFAHKYIDDRNAWYPRIEWIPVSERLPEKPEYDWVLVRVKMVPEGWYGVPHIAELRNGVWYADCYDTPLEETISVTVTDWMPLPDDTGRMEL